MIILKGICVNCRLMVLCIYLIFAVTSRNTLQLVTLLSDSSYVRERGGREGAARSDPEAVRAHENLLAGIIYFDYIVLFASPHLPPFSFTVFHYTFISILLLFND